MFFPATDWCGKVRGNFPKEQWVALIPRNNSSSQHPQHCTINQKIVQAKTYNASAVIFYNNIDGEVPVIKGDTFGLVTVMIDMKDGKVLVDEVLKKTSENKMVFVEILVGTHYVDRKWKVSRTSVLFVLVSFILLMCISLAWLVFYYVQRFRHIYRNDRKEVK